jgi:hypothetical protein
MSEATTEKLVRAYQSIRAGNLPLARSIIKEVLQASPGSERAWLMMSLAVEDPQQQADCLQRVLRLNPNNPTALARLTAITASISESAPDRAAGQTVARPSRLPELSEPTPQAAPWLYQPTTPGFEPDALRAAIAARRNGSTGSLPTLSTPPGANRDAPARATVQTETAPSSEVPSWLKTRPNLPLVPPPPASLPSPPEPLPRSERILRWLVPALIGAWAVLILVALVVVFVSLR